MFECRWSKQVDRWFDGDSMHADAVARHVNECLECRLRLERMRRLRKGVQATAMRAEISHAQFPAFMEGIRDRIERRAPRRSGMWAVVSLSAAALLVSVSIFAMFTGPEPAKAHTTEVESATTEMDGATIKTQDSTADTPAIVWVHVPRRDVL